METSNTACRRMVVTPHHLATQSALSVLREGGTAMEATVAAAATIAVVYPHMNSIGGDGFWLIVPPEGDPIVIEACGPAGSLATTDFFKGYNTIPFQGPKAANTVAGTIGGWIEALNYVTECGYQRKSLSTLLADAIAYADYGFPVSTSQEKDTCALVNSKIPYSGNFERIFLPNGKIIKEGEMFYQKNLANTLKMLVENGLESFYKGDVAKLIAKDCKHLGMPVTESDLANYHAVRKAPLRFSHTHGELFNVPPPTQGIASLCILGILDKLHIRGTHEGEFIHATVEATKQAFHMRNQHITDPDYMTINPETLLSESNILKLANNIDKSKAWSFGESKVPGDTVWFGVMDDKGFSVSYIQSIYHSFGSKVVLPNTGILWHNRGISFSLQNDHLLYIKPGKKPFHTLNPAAAKLRDGRVIIYGTRGGDGQPQTQAAIFHRYVIQGMPLQKSIFLPRWVYGRTTGNHHTRLYLEDRFAKETVKFLKERGHDIMMLPPFDDTVGQAGALVRHRNGVLEGAYDIRSDGSAAGF